MSFNLNMDSVRNLCPTANHAMVYGWKSCKYMEVADAMEEDSSPISKIFDWNIGDPTIDKEHRRTLEGRVMSQIAFDSSKDTDIQAGRTCKSAIVDLMIENYKRKQENLPLIPLIFCNDITDKERLITPENIAETSEEKVITNSELRRCYKISCEINDKEKLIPVAEIAKEYIKFVKLVETNRTEYKLEPIRPFWETKAWEISWKLRKVIKGKNQGKPKQYHWKTELSKKIAAYDFNAKIKKALNKKMSNIKNFKKETP
jgi:hypothetical protein